MANAPGRVIVATFASLISRVQQIIDAADANGRRVFVTGRSMMNNVEMAIEQGYLDAPDDILAPLDRMKKLPPEKIAIITTGAQGEPTSALVRMANRDHRHIEIEAGDTVVFSSSAIPGNELLINRTIDNLYRLGAHVLFSRIANVHVRGHAAQEELKLMLSLAQPKYFVPVHGEYRHLVMHAQIARSMGMPDENIFIMEDGDILEIDRRGREGRRAHVLPTTSTSTGLRSASTRLSCATASTWRRTASSSRSWLSTSTPVNQSAARTLYLGDLSKPRCRTALWKEHAT